jgi:hypothetical protein
MQLISHVNRKRELLQATKQTYSKQHEVQLCDLQQATL